MLNRAKISINIYKQLERKGLLRDIRILRNKKNVFGENNGPLEVCNVKGYYYKKNNKLSISTNTGATTNRNYNDKLLLIINEDSLKINKDDYFLLDNISFKIIDPNNIEDLVFDMYLERI